MTKTLPPEPYAELAQLAIERCRDSALSVIQLMDDPMQRIGVLTSIAVDMVEGSIQQFEDEAGMKNYEALGAAVALVTEGIGRDRIHSAMLAAKKALGR